jgi:S-adenosylmethionine/arginine decarboxylase-like enzyme
MDHKHLILDVTLKSPPTSVRQVEGWLVRLVSVLGMKLLSGPHVCACNDLGNEGVTGLVVLSTSHCSIHVWDKAEPPFARIDVYSCKPFDISNVEKLVMEFDPIDCRYIVIDRNNHGPVTVQQSLSTS